MRNIHLVIIALVLPLVSLDAEAVSQTEVTEFFKIDEEAYKKDNALIAAVGLTAPSNVNDSYSWALNLIQSDKQDQLPQTFETLPNRLPTPAVAKNNPLACWLGKKPNEVGVRENNKLCYTKAEIEALIADNKIFLVRFQQLSQMQHFVDLPEHFLTRAQELIIGEKLFLIKLTFDANQDREAALKLWLANMKSARSWNQDQGGLVQRSVALVIYRLVLNQLPAILDDDKILANKYRQDLSLALAPFPAKDMNLLLAMKTDFQFAKIIFESLGEHAMQSFYNMDHDFAAMAEVPAFEFQKANTEFIAKYGKTELPLVTGIKMYLRMHHFSFIPFDQKDKDAYGDFLIKGITAASSMVDTMNVVDANTRMYGIYVQVRAQNIAREKIGDFIKNAPPEMQDPFSGKAFNYDDKTNTVMSACRNVEKVPTTCTLSLD